MRRDIALGVMESCRKVSADGVASVVERKHTFVLAFGTDQLHGGTMVSVLCVGKAVNRTR